jgi:hypothetical protein
MTLPQIVPQVAPSGISGCARGNGKSWIFLNAPLCHIAANLEALS